MGSGKFYRDTTKIFPRPLPPAIENDIDNMIMITAYDAVIQTFLLYGWQYIGTVRNQLIRPYVFTI